MALFVSHGAATRQQLYKMNLEAFSIPNTALQVDREHKFSYEL